MSESSDSEEEERAVWNEFQKEYGEEVYHLSRRAQLLKKIALILSTMLLFPIILPFFVKPAMTSNSADMFFIFLQVIPAGIFIRSRMIVLGYNNLWRKFKAEHQAID